jgi:Fuc2NAc and GlcNAc transferase
VVSDALTVLLGLAAGLVLEFGVLYLVQKPHLLATPTARSSHTEPTPTMGGVVIVLVVLAYFGVLSDIDARLGWGLFAALAALAVVGLWDDLSGLSARFRLAVHFLAAVAVLWTLQLAQPWWLLAAFLIGLVWLVNLYNFMDGIDGFAAMQCLIYCVGAHWVATGVPGWTGDLLWLLAGSTLAFLAFNWPPAKIFMGDVGSGFLGLLIGAMCLYLWQSGSVGLVSSMILLSVFWFDATYTLCVRIVTQQKFTQAHRSHVYQHVAQRQGHLWTTVAFLVYAAVWLLPLAWFAESQTEYPFQQIMLLVVSVIPMAILCWRLGAGTQYRES